MSSATTSTEGGSDEGDLDADARRTGLPDRRDATLRPEVARPHGGPRVGTRLSPGGRGRGALQPADRLRARRREGVADARAPRDGRRERRAARVLAVVVRLCQRGSAPLGAARARGRDRDARRGYDQDAMTRAGSTVGARASGSGPPAAGLGRAVSPVLSSLTLPGYGEAAAAMSRTTLGARQRARGRA